MRRRLVFRVQDTEGRGPWRPGFSRVWVQPRPDHMLLAPFFVEFPGVLKAVLPGERLGSGCNNPSHLRRWFTEKEYRTLKKLGYSAVALEVDRILAESDVQVVFVRALPFNTNTTPISLYDG